MSHACCSKFCMKGKNNEMRSADVDQNAATRNGDIKPKLKTRLHDLTSIAELTLDLKLYFNDLKSTCYVAVMRHLLDARLRNCYLELLLFRYFIHGQVSRTNLSTLFDTVASLSILLDLLK